MEWIENEGKNLFLIYHLFFKTHVHYVTSTVLDTIKDVKEVTCIDFVLKKLTSDITDSIEVHIESYTIIYNHVLDCVL